MKLKTFLALFVCSIVPVGLWAADTTVRKAPDFAIEMPDGSKISLSQYHGKVVVLAMILTTCPHCQAATRILAALQNEFGPKGLQVLEAAMDQNHQTNLPTFIKTYNPPFPVGFTSVLNAELFMRFDTNQRYYVPYITFIDREGMIHGQYKGDDAFNKEENLAGNCRKMVVALIGKKESARK